MFHAHMSSGAGTIDWIVTDGPSELSLTHLKKLNWKDWIKMNMQEGREIYKSTKQKQNKQTPWPLVRQRTIPTERPPFVDEI
jgi:hypothetical protein